MNYARSKKRLFIAYSSQSPQSWGPRVARKDYDRQSSKRYIDDKRQKALTGAKQNGIVILLQDFNKCLYSSEQWDCFQSPSTNNHNLLHWYVPVHKHDRGILCAALLSSNESLIATVPKIRLRAQNKQFLWYSARITCLRNSLATAHGANYVLELNNIHKITTQGAKANLPVSDHGAQVQNADEGKAFEIFIRGLCHDLNTPLTVISLGLQRLQHTPRISETKRDGIIERVLFNVARVNAMIGDLLQSTRFSGMHVASHALEEANFNEIVQKTAETLAHSLQRHISFSCVPTIAGYWDVEHIRRIVENLVNNACKYGDTKKPILVSTYLASTKTAVLAVQSWGNPIDPQDLPTIFKPFARLRQKADKHNKNSWGLGLAMVQALAKANLGTVSVSSTRESGTTFFVRLPVKEVLLEPRHAKIA